jgi:hypothetical protein
MTSTLPTLPRSFVSAGFSGVRSPAPRFAATGTGAVIFKSRDAMELDALRSIIPSAFAEEKHASRSDRYAYIPTAEVLRKLYAEGWRVFSAKQGGSREEEKRGFTKHQLRMRHVSTVALVPGEVIGEVILTNSHDGTSAYHLQAGAFRVVCANGLTTPQGLAEAVRVPHKGNVAELVIDGCVSLVKQFPLIGHNIREMQALALTPGESVAFGRAALALRYGAEPAPVTAEKILEPRRTADIKPDVFTTFNRIQENMVKGGLRYVDRDENGRMKAIRKTREVKGIDTDTNLNRGLWTLAEEMRKLKQG